MILIVAHPQLLGETSRKEPVTTKLSIAITSRAEAAERLAVEAEDLNARVGRISDVDFVVEDAHASRVDELSVATALAADRAEELAVAESKHGDAVVEEVSDEESSVRAGHAKGVGEFSLASTFTSHSHEVSAVGSRDELDAMFPESATSSLSLKKQSPRGKENCPGALPREPNVRLNWLVSRLKTERR